MQIRIGTLIGFHLTAHQGLIPSSGRETSENQVPGGRSVRPTRFKMAAASYENYVWYFGRISRHEAENLLQGKKPGLYLVRESATSPGDFVLCVSENGRVSHYIINLRGDQLIIGDQRFGDLPKLIDFYRIHYLDTTTLTEACPKEEPSPAPSPPPQQSCAPDMQTNSTPNSSTTGSLATSPTPQGGEKYITLYRFVGKDQEDLPFEKSEVIEIIEKTEEQWWKARNQRGQTGMVPVPYIRRHQVEQSNYRQINPAQTQWAVVLKDRTPSAYDNTQLRIHKDDIIKVLTQHVNGQWEGELEGRRGFFPFNYVKLISPEELETLRAEKSNGPDPPT